MAQLTPQPGIMDIALYQGGKSHIAGHQDVLKLSSNENPFGPSPAAMAAVGAAVSNLHRYPTTDQAALRGAIGEVWGLDPARIICGAGSDEILSWICYAYAGPGDEVLYHEHGFSMYRITALAAGARPVSVPETNRTVDIDKLLAGVTDRTKIVFVTNPGNPTGTCLQNDALARLADALPAHVLLVLDGAYAEFAEGHDGGAAVVRDRENVIMTRTFSKLYGLGGLRIGWAYGAQFVIDVLNRVRGPFNLSGVQLAAAEAAVRDHGFVEQCLTANAEVRARLTEALIGRGIAVDPSTANFVMARFANEATAGAVDTPFAVPGDHRAARDRIWFPRGAADHCAHACWAGPSVGRV